MGNKLSVYLIKKGITQACDIVTNYERHIKVSGGDFYTAPSRPKQPVWVKSFFGSELKVDFLSVSNAKGIYLVRIKQKGEEILFALSFGAGRHMLKPGVIEENFGLKVILNSVQHKNIKGIKKHNIGALVKRTDEQMSRGAEAADFGINFEQDLLTGLKGKSNHEFLGKTIQGADSLVLNVPISVKSAGQLLGKIYSRYESEEYKANFDWVDHISFVRDPQLIKILNKELIKLLNRGNFQNVCIAPPEVIDYVSIAGLAYTPYQKTPDEDIDINKLIDSFEGNLSTIDQLEHRKVRSLTVDTYETRDSWPVLKCISAELEYKKRQHVITNGKWYEIDKDFVKEVTTYVDNISLTQIELPNFDHRTEAEYNAFSCSLYPEFALMDKKNIGYGGGRSKVEFCDILTKDQKLIFIKQHGSSAALSHLFNQGAVTGELLFSDAEFRRKLNTYLPAGFKVKNPAINIKPEEYEIVFGIIDSKKIAKPRIPFFSKVTLRTTVKRLISFGYKVTIKHIQGK